ncbi:glycosyltransferase family 2 protein [Petrachloros mirabilis]
MNASIGEKISVCLLTYNHAHVIESTLRSILDQTITGYEVIVSDDCSTDGTWERVLELAAQDERLRPVRTPHNTGMPGNANFAVSQSSRPYIALLHHDDLYRKDLLEKWGVMIERDSDIAFVFNAYGVYESDYVYSESIPAGRLDGRWLLENILFPRWGSAIRGTAMIRRSAWEQLGGMRERFGLLADVDLWMRLSRSWSAAYVPDPVIVVRQQRPDYYPDIYKDGHWSWCRHRYLYEIHAANRLEYLNRNRIMGRLKWLGFRIRLNLETARWLAYAMVKGKFYMIETSGESITDYDLFPLRLLRSTLRGLVISRTAGKA